MKMNTVIQEKRRALGLTQEQVAEHLGVSIPAVSKWETGQTCPDVALLPRLARLLKIDLNTLFSFQETLSQEEIRNICAAITEKGNTDTIAAAFALAEEQLREYPHCEELLQCVTYALQAVVNMPGRTGEEYSVYDEQVNVLLEQLAESTNPAIQNSANFLLANKSIRQGDYDRAQQILDRMPDKQSVTQEMADKQMLQIIIHQYRGNYDEAARELEYALFAAANRLQMLISLYVSLEMTAGNPDHARDVASKGTEFAELFQLWDYTCRVSAYQVALKARDTDEVLALLRKLLTALKHPWDTAHTTLFRQVEWNISEAQQQEFLRGLLGQLEHDPEYAFLRSDPRFGALVAEFQT